MAVEPDELEVFVERKGPIHVVDRNGSAISYGTTGRLDMIDPDQKDTWSAQDVELTLLDEMSQRTRAIPGDHITAVREVGPGYEVVVIDEKPDPGAFVQTRGAPAG